MHLEYDTQTLKLQVPLSFSGPFCPRLVTVVYDLVGNPDLLRDRTRAQGCDLTNHTVLLSILRQKDLSSRWEVCRDSEQSFLEEAQPLGGSLSLLSCPVSHESFPFPDKYI